MRIFVAGATGWVGFPIVQRAKALFALRRNAFAVAGTARDYGRFLETIRRGGELDGVRILSARAARLMRTNQSGTLHSSTGVGFGYGFDVAERYGAKGLTGVGAFGWGGAYGTTYQVDPESGLVIVFMMQLMPNTTDIQQKFLNTVYQALE